MGTDMSLTSTQQARFALTWRATCKLPRLSPTLCPPPPSPCRCNRFARECFSIIDADNNGTLEAEELLAVFKVSRHACAPCPLRHAGTQTS